MGGVWECSLRHGSDVFSNRRLDDLNKKLFFVSLLFLSGSLLSVSDANAAKQPNIVWFVIDDLSTNFSCCD